MTKVQSDISKIEQILQSENYEAGFELLRTKNDPALNEALSALIQSTVRSKYFEEVSNQKEIDKGLEILNDLLPNLTSLEVSYSYAEELDISKFKKLEILNLSHSECLGNVKGLDKLDKLTSIDITGTPLYPEDFEIGKKSLKITGNKDLHGMIIEDEDDYHSWWEVLDGWLDSFRYKDKDNLGTVFFIYITDFDFQEQDFNWQTLTTILDGDFSKLSIWLERSDKIDKLNFKDAINKDCLTVCLLNFGVTYDVIASFSVYKENLEVDCDECFATLTYDETIQVDPDDEWIRCCPDCAKERNKKKSMK